MAKEVLEYTQDLQDLIDRLESKNNFGSRSNLPSTLNKGHEYLIVSQNGNTLNVPLLLKGNNENKPVLVSPNFVLGDLFMSGGAGEYEIDWRGGAYRNKIVLNRSQEGVFENTISNSNPEPASNQRTVNYAQDISYGSDAEARRLTINIDTNGQVTVQVRNLVGSRVDPTGVIRKTITIGFDINSANTTTQKESQA